MNCEPTAIPGVLLVTPKVFPDARGFFLETFSERRYREAGITARFVQDNYSHSVRNTVRGLHYQLRQPQAKLVSVIWGTIYDVAVDIRAGSPTFGKWVGQILSDENRAQLFIPEGFAHGFSVLSERADVMYKCSDYYAPGDDRGILWSDPAIAVDWHVREPIVSDKDRRYAPLAAVPPRDLPVYGG
jgi:dTDP-4-dehydrorhamnose 3,5-epimerase